MLKLGEATRMKIYTTERLLCIICQKYNNFMYVVKKDGSKYYLMEMCPKCNKHFEDVREIPSRMAKDYPAVSEDK